MKALFIVGFWNSGTTLLVDVLRKHPSLSLRKARYKPNLEERTIKKILNKLGSGFWDFSDDYEEVMKNGFVNYQEPDFDEAKRQRFRKIFNWHFWVRKHKILLLKNPWLFYFNTFIDKTFAADDIKKVVILRNGYSQSVSKDYWSKNQENPEKHLTARAVFWKKSMERFFETWYKDEKCLTIRYENLCKNPEKAIRDVCDFLEIPFEPLKDKLPKAFENRMTNWDNLDADLKRNIENEINEIQLKMDKEFPME
jgi:hypothetical protein